MRDRARTLSDPTEFKEICDSDHSGGLVDRNIDDSFHVYRDFRTCYLQEKEQTSKYSIKEICLLCLNKI